MSRPSPMAVVLIAACARDEVALDLELVPDPSISSPEEIADRIDTVVYVIDSPQGLYPAGSEQVDGDVQIKNADGDEDLELVASTAVDGHLPRTRLRRGGLPDVPLEIRVSGSRLGDGSGTRVAVGRLQAVRFEDGEVTRVAVPFNLLPDQLPPRVTEVLPQDGASAAGCEVESVVVTFSKPVDPDSLEGGMTVEPGGPPRDVRLELGGLVAVYEPTSLTGDGATVAYHVTVGTGILALDGQGFDQITTEPGEQPFAADFELPCSVPSQFPTRPCGEGAGGVPFCPGEPRFECVDEQCVSSGCAVSACEDGFVCDPAVGLCVPSCAPYGDDFCPADRPFCAPEGGACQAWPGT